MQSLSEIELDLKWFYQCGDGDCGNSSAQGHLLDVAELGVWSHGGVRDPFDSERQLENVGRYRDIQNRLFALTPEAQAILAAAYDSPEAIRDVGLTLAALTPKAKELHLKTGKLTLLTREWLLLLAARANRKSAKELLTILSEARTIRQEALATYQSKTEASGREAA